jgi:N6-adenosine-specific RNA methylase IME4
MKFSTIVADPPWPYKSPGGHLRPSPEQRPNSWDSPKAGPGSRDRYGAMTMPELLALRPRAADNAHLYLWTTNAFMVEAHEVAKAWGFEQKTILTWTKTLHEDHSRPSMKTGYYFRGATEHCLFCVRGSLKLQTDEALPTAFLWPREPHSVKPDAFYDLVEKASPGPYLEMFARRARLGDWHYWGDESLSTVEVGRG